MKLFFSVSLGYMKLLFLQKKSHSLTVLCSQRAMCMKCITFIFLNTFVFLNITFTVYVNVIIFTLSYCVDGRWIIAMGI